MAAKRSYNLYLSEYLHNQLSRSTEAGLPASSVASLAIRKWEGGDLPSGDECSCPVRVNIYLTPSDADVLGAIASSHSISRADALRRLITVYIDQNRDAISRMF